jgi:hypothetical protein
MKVNQATVNLLSSILEIFATARSALATYAISMSVTNGDQTFSIFTTSVVEGALVLSMLSIGFDPVSPVTAVAALVFSAVMQYIEVVTLTGQLSPDQKQTLILALAFAPTVLLALGILRRLSEGGNTGALGELFGRLAGWFKQEDTKKSRAYAFEVKMPKMAKRKKTSRPFRRGSKRAG